MNGWEVADTKYIPEKEKKRRKQAQFSNIAAGKKKKSNDKKSRAGYILIVKSSSSEGLSKERYSVTNAARMPFEFPINNLFIEQIEGFSLTFEDVYSPSSLTGAKEKDDAF